MTYAVLMGSGAMIYLPSFIKFGSGIQKLTGGTHRQHGDRVCLILFFQNKESRLEENFVRTVSKYRYVANICMLL
jgi:hypothetical protein